MANNDWNTIKYSLTDKLLSEAIYGKDFPRLGMFNSFQTKFFVLDIDAHANNANIIPIIYEELITKFAYPSFVAHSPRGIHVYYLLSNFYHSTLLANSIKGKLAQYDLLKDIEVRPTHNNGLRLPSTYHILNRNNINLHEKVRKGQFGKYLDNRVHYFAEEFIFESKKALANPKAKDYVDTGVICKGTTNDALNHYIPLWKGQGFSDDECYGKFCARLEPTYSGDILNYATTINRISTYSGSECYFDSSKADTSPIGEKYKVLIENVLKMYKYTKNDHNDQLRLNSIKEDLLKILWLYETNNGIYENLLALSIHSQNNPYFKHEMDRGCFPIPSTFIRKKNIDFFMSISFLTLPYGRHYHVAKKSCIHYSINVLNYNTISIIHVGSKNKKCNTFIIPFPSYLISIHSKFPRHPLSTKTRLGRYYGRKMAIGPPSYG